jgi:signal transduction histidine kinase
MGLRGMEERVREIHGVVSIHCRAGAGMPLEIDVSVPAGEANESAAG